MMFRSGIRSVVVAVAVASFGLGSAQAWKILNVPSDDTIWKPLPSLLYVQADVIPPHDASRVAIRKGDFIVSFGERIPDDADAVKRILAENAPTSEFSIEVFRPEDARRYTVQVSGSDLPKDFVRDVAGFYVDRVMRNGSAERAGVKRGDVVVAIDGDGFSGIQVSDPWLSLLSRGVAGARSLNYSLEAEQRLRNSRIGQKLDFTVLRAGAPLSARVLLGRRMFGMPLFLVILIVAWAAVGWLCASAVYGSRHSVGQLLLLAFGYLMLLIVDRDPQYTSRALVFDVGLLLSAVVVVVAARHSPRRPLMDQPLSRMAGWIEARFSVEDPWTNRLADEDGYPREAVEFLEHHETRFKTAISGASYLRQFLVVLVWLSAASTVGAGNWLLAGAVCFVVVASFVYMLLERTYLTRAIRIVDDGWTTEDGDDPVDIDDLDEDPKPSETAEPPENRFPAVLPPPVEPNRDAGRLEAEARRLETTRKRIVGSQGT